MKRFPIADFRLWIGAPAIFIVALALALLAAPLAVGAQQAGKVYRIAYVTFPASPAPFILTGLQAFRHALRDLGWIEGQNVVIEMRTGVSGKNLQEVFAQVVREKFDLIVTSSTPSALAAKGATTTIPIVMAEACDPLVCGVVDSLAHPGGNVTGLALMASEVAGKRIEFLKEIVPGLRRVAAIGGPGTKAFCAGVAILTQYEATARALGITLQAVELIGVDRYDAAFAALKKDGVGALAMAEGPGIDVESPQIAAAALKHGLATVFPYGAQVQTGGLMSYGTNLIGMWQRAAHFVDRILRGAKPGDLPVEQPTKFDLIINLKTAKALGLTIPPALRIRADEVIE